MNGAQDLGGMMGFGPIGIEADEPMFHAAWEARALAVTLAVGFLGRWSIDEARHARESLPPPVYLTSSYYEIWTRGLETLIRRHGLATSAELETGQPDPAAPALPADLKPAPGPDAAAAILARGSSARRADARPPRFTIGDRVRVRDINTPAHTRAPRYVRGRVGEIVRLHGGFVFPDTGASGAGEQPQACYAVRFAARDLWGETAHPRDCVHADLWDDHLEPAA
ncbi:nitrile hydratase [Tistrella bauzanensis]|uniref:Nitrile hydratase subunit beta n=1 Tax=Tistrella bauzanensis TaxID=657419 RepID=A0ABQ1IN47_9PROT|nr:nitrile hydratase subunit beta [Tistrella bauzanensis]GGB46240.1 nitrile hydratase [Tistrella bauzanensis]